MRRKQRELALPVYLTDMDRVHMQQANIARIQFYRDTFLQFLLQKCT